MDAQEIIGELLDNEFTAGFLCFVALVVLGYLYLPLWIFVFSASVSYIGFDFFMSILIEQGEGYVKIGMANEFQTKGHGFLAFFLLIVIGTGLISWLVDFVVSTIQAQGGLLIVFLSAIGVLAVLAESEFRFAGGS